MATVGQHVRLGYLESLAGSARRDGPVGSARRAASETRPRPRTPSRVARRHGADGPPPLESPCGRQQGRRETAAAAAGHEGKLADHAADEFEGRLERAHQPHRTSPGTPSSRPPVIPGQMGQRGAEQITVTEKDLRRCGNNLKMLRECHQQQLQRAQEAQQGELDLSFKMAFAKRCRSDVDLRDPWKDMSNPEETRAKSEYDLILNQVWVAQPKKGLSFDASAAAAAKEKEGDAPAPASARRSASVSTRASSVDLAYAGVVGREGRRRSSKGSSGLHVQHRAESRSRPTSGTKSRSGSKASARIVAQDPPQDSKVKNRIQPYESPRSEGDLEDDGLGGSALVRQAIRMQRHFAQKIDESRHCSGSGHSAWMALDRKSGVLHLYPKEAALRIELAYRQGRTSVPLAGVGDPFEGIIVQLSNLQEGSRPVERTWEGDENDVRRVDVQVFMTDAVAYVYRQDREWHFADAPVPGVTEERRVQLSRNEVVPTPSPSLPPVNPDRRPQCFLNPGADWDWAL